MHILFISRSYSPEITAAAICVSAVAERLVQRGHQVTILTTVPRCPNGVISPTYRGKRVQVEEIDGVRVVRTWSYIRPNRSFVWRIVAQLSFALLAPLLCWRACGRPDLIIVNSPPLLNLIAARILARLWRISYIFWLTELWPEWAVQLGTLRNRLFIRLAEWLEWTSYRRARLIWVVTVGMRIELLRRGLAANHVFLLPIGIDTSLFRPGDRDQARVALDWDERFTVLYLGTHGLAHGLTTLLDAAELLRAESGIRVVLVGDGTEKPALLAMAQQRRLTNIAFLAPFPHDQVPQLLAAADACLVQMHKVKIFERMLPIKMYEAMACGCPLLLALNGEARRVAEEEARAALAVEPENAEELAQAIRYLATHPAEARLMGERGRAYALAHFNYDLFVQQLETKLAWKSAIPMDV